MPLPFLPPPFDAVPEQDRALLAEKGYIWKVAKGQKLLQQGEVPPFGYFVQSGWCTVSEYGHTLKICGRGCHLIDGLPPSRRSGPTVTALGPMLVLCLDFEALRLVLDRNATLTGYFFEETFRLLAKARCSYATRGTQHLEHRIVDVLWDIGEHVADGTRNIPPEITQSVLASLMGASREEVSRKWQILFKSGHLLRREGKWVLSALVPTLLASLPESLFELDNGFATPAVA